MRAGRWSPLALGSVTSKVGKGNEVLTFPWIQRPRGTAAFTWEIVEDGRHVWI